MLSKIWMPSCPSITLDGLDDFGDRDITINLINSVNGYTIMYIPLIYKSSNQLPYMIPFAVGA